MQGRVRIIFQKQIDRSLHTITHTYLFFVYCYPFFPSQHDHSLLVIHHYAQSGHQLAADRTPHLEILYTGLLLLRLSVVNLCNKEEENIININEGKYLDPNLKSADMSKLSDIFKRSYVRSLGNLQKDKSH